MRFRLSLLPSLLYLLSLCAALPSVFPAENYAAGCFGVLRLTYSWTQCADVAPATLPLCLCKTPEVMQTCIGCVDQLMANITCSERDALRQRVYHILATQCASAKVNMSLIEQYHNQSKNLEPYDMERPKAMVRHWKATRAFKLTSSECRKAVIANYADNQLAPRTNTAAGAALGYWGCVLLIRIIVHWTSVLCPRTVLVLNTRLVKKLRQYFTLPAALTSRHSEALHITRYIPLNIPTREQSLTIFGFVAVYVCLTFAYNPYWPDSYIWRYDNTLQFNQALAFRAGKMAVFQLPLVILFAGRNNLLQWFTGWPHDTFVVFHKWIARCIGFSILTHASSWTVARVHLGTYSAMWMVGYWKCGIIAGIGCCMIVFQGMAAFRRLHYETFLVLHILLALLFIIGAYYHLKLMQEELQYFYATFAVWSFDRAFRILRVVVNNPLAKADVKVHGDNVLEMTVTYSRLWKPRPGMYAFIHMVQPAFFWESHPFTLTFGVRPGEEDKLKVFCRVKDGMTRRTLRQALQHKGAFTAKVWIDGPYGPSHNLKDFNEVVFVTGGIGITSPFSYIHALLQEKNCRTSKITLYWAMRDDSALEWFGNELYYLRKSGRVEVNIMVGGGGQCDPDLESEDSNAEGRGAEAGGILETRAEQTSIVTRSSESNSDREKAPKPASSAPPSRASKEGSLFHVTYGSFDTRTVVSNAIEMSRGSLGLLCCGPGRMNDDCRYAVTNGLQMTSNFVGYFEESFSW